MSDSSADTMSKITEPLVCFCHGVSESLIRAAIRNGAKTLEQVQEATKASTGCGGCTSEVERLLEEELKGASLLG